MLIFTSIKSPLNNLTKIDIGKKTKIKIIPIITGETILPNKIPNLNHILFGILSKEGCKNETKKNTIENTKKIFLI